MRTLVLSLFLLILAGCLGQDPRDQRLKYPDLVDHHGIPSAAEDWSPVPFSDQGAWFGFTLPPVDESSSSGGFCGPFLMTSGRWLGPQLARLDGANAQIKRSLGLPGSLEQEYLSGDLRIAQSLWFDQSHLALIRSRVHNQGKTPVSFEPVWTGSIFPEMGTLEGTDTGILVQLADSTKVRISTDQEVRQVQVSNGSYRLTLAENFTIAPGDSVTILLAITMAPVGDPELDPAPILADHDSSREHTFLRWENYLEAIDCGRGHDDPAQILAVKSIQTLVNNWRGPAGRMRHGGLFPSSNVWYFNGFWAWDSWKHAVGLALFDTEIAADQLRLMFDHQDDQGMIADVVYLDSGEDNWRNTKPPLAGWALEMVFNKSGQIELVQELYPQLVAYHQFWYTHRDHDGDGLCEYGSTDGTIVAARWESGMDNAVRFDATGMLQNGPHAWSMDQESVDLNSYLYREKLALHNLATALGRDNEAKRWINEATALGQQIQESMFDEITGWFYDIDIDDGSFVSVQGPEGWTPLWAGVANPSQASRLKSAMLDTTKFRTHVPFPTVARDDPGFSDGYWRGLVWVDQIYFAIEGLRNYGFEDEAESLTRQVLANIQGATVPGKPLRENYHPLTGEGRNVKHFSWSAAHFLMLTQAQQ